MSKEPSVDLLFGLNINLLEGKTVTKMTKRQAKELLKLYEQLSEAYKAQARVYIEMHKNADRIRTKLFKRTQEI